MSFQQTLQNPATIEGVGLHSGAHVKLRLVPQSEGGLVFVRTDLQGQPQIPATARHIGSTLHATRLEYNNAAISTPEHLLAALWSYGVTQCTIEVDGPEIPILDGSAKLWCELIEKAGIKALPEKRPKYSLREPLAVHAENGAVIGLPYGSFRVTTDVEYNVPYLEIQTTTCEVTREKFRDELAPARTFTLEEWIEPLRAANLIRGGTTENALVLSKEGASTPLRFSNELARHKAMDLIGDVSLLFGENGGLFQVHLIAIRAGHELHRQWMEKAFKGESLIRLP